MCMLQSPCIGGQRVKSTTVQLLVSFSTSVFPEQYHGSQWLFNSWPAHFCESSTVGELTQRQLLAFAHWEPRSSHVEHLALWKSWESWSFVQQTMTSSLVACALSATFTTFEHVWGPLSPRPVIALWHCRGRCGLIYSGKQEDCCRKRKQPKQDVKVLRWPLKWLNATVLD